MKKSIIIALLWVISSTSAADSCDEYALEVSTDYLEDIEEINADFDKSLMSSNKYYQRHKIDPAITFEMLADVWKNYFEYDKHYQRFNHEIYDVAASLNTDPKSRKYCDDQETLENWLERRVEYYQKLIVRIAESISSRVELESIEENEGLAIISAYSYGVAPKMTLVGDGLLNSIKIGPLVYDQHFEIRKLSRATYRWERVELGFDGFALQDSNIDVAGTTTYSFYDFVDEDFSFKVEPGKLNFAGVFIFEQKDGGARGDLYDRSSILIRLLEEQYPYLLTRYEWHNALAPADPFLEYYYTQRFKSEIEQ